MRSAPALRQASENEVRDLEEKYEFLRADRPRAQICTESRVGSGVGGPASVAEVLGVGGREEGT